MGAKNIGKKIVSKSAKKRFLQSYECFDKKWGRGGGKCAKQFFQKHTNSASKKCWEKNRSKKGQKTFFIFSRYSYQEMVGGKNHENIFLETHE